MSKKVKYELLVITLAI